MFSMYYKGANVQLWYASHKSLAPTKTAVSRNLINHVKSWKENKVDDVRNVTRLAYFNFTHVDVVVQNFIQTRMNILLLSVYITLWISRKQ